MEKIKIVHIDDSHDFIDIFSIYFSSYFDIVSFSHPDEVLTFLRQEKCHLVVSDYELPGMNGLELLKRIKKEFPHIPVIFYTGQGNESIAREAFLSGVSDYFCKDTLDFIHRERFVNVVKNAVEKIRSQEILMETQLNFKHIVENINDVIYVLDIDGKINYISPVVESLLGYLPWEVTGRNFVEFVHNEDQELVQEKIERILTGNPYPASFRLLKKSGEICWVRTSTRLSSKREFFGVLSDITRQKQAEEKILQRLLYEKALSQASRVLLHAGAEAVRKVLYYLLSASSSDRVYIFENFYEPVDGLCMRQTYEVCREGVTPQIDNPVLQYFPYKSGAQRWQRELSQGKALYGHVKDFPVEEREILEPQGVLSVLVLPVYVRGDWYGFIGFDDTHTEREWQEEDILLLRTASEMIGTYIERKNIEETLEMERNTFAGGPVMVFRWLPQSGTPVDYVSPNVTCQLGYSPHEFIGGGILYQDIIHPEDANRVMEEVVFYSMSGVEHFEQQYRLRDRQGNYRRFYDYTQIVRNSQGIVSHYQGYLMEIPERSLFY